MLANRIFFVKQFWKAASASETLGILPSEKFERAQILAFQKWFLELFYRRQAGIFCLFAERLLYSKQLVVFCHAIGARWRAGFDESAIECNAEVSDRDILGFTASVRGYRRHAIFLSKFDRIDRFRKRANLVDFDVD